MPERPLVEERENGPLMVRGATGLVAPDGAELEVKPAMALCRCGQSATKPFCDGSHKDAGFAGPGATLGADNMNQGCTEITISENGPYKFAMPEGAGDEKVFLCRCGLSSNKPFCDGSHKKQGWTA